MRSYFNYLLGQLTPKYGAIEARQMALMLLEDLAQTKASRLLMEAIDLTHAQQQTLQQQVQRLQANEPIQYVLQKAWFYDRSFRVGPAVLIPRPETEELVQWVLQSSQQAQAQVLDVGTGSGCIATTLAAERPTWQVTAIDFSNQALALAQHNAQQYHCTIHWHQADVLQWQQHPTLAQAKWHLIVSNPPYVTRAEQAQMAPHVVDHEPHLALFVDNTQPLIFYRHIGEMAAQQLVPGGFLFFEINQAFGHQVCSLLHELGLHNIELRQDLSGKDRMVRAQKPEL